MNSNVTMTGGGEEGVFAVMAAMLVFIVLAVAIGVAIQAVIAWIVSSCLAAVPEEFRKQQPAMAWLLLIPLFNLVWNFFVHPKLAESYRAYFAASGDTTVGDAGGNLALWHCICAVGACVPYLNCVAGPAALILLIIWLVKAVELRRRIQQQTGGMMQGG